MTEKTEKASGDTVEVRLLAPHFQHEQADGSIVVRKRDEKFHVSRKIYDSSIEPDRGMGRPAHSRTFVALEDEKAKKAAVEDTAQKVQDRIAAVRASVQDQDRAFDAARASAKVLEAENAQKIVDALKKNSEGEEKIEAVLKPLERAGGRRVS